jgi:integrase
MIYVVQDKTGARVWIPIAPELTAAMQAYSANGLSLIGTENGRPIKRAALSALMRAAIKQADLPRRCVSHGLRKAAMRLLAENDATDKQIASISGHKTLKEVERYTKAADQKKLARAGMDKLRDRK